MDQRPSVSYTTSPARKDVSESDVRDAESVDWQIIAICELRDRP